MSEIFIYDDMTKNRKPLFHWKVELTDVLGDEPEKSATSLAATIEEWLTERDIKFEQQV